MESPSSANPSWERRRAWARRTRHWHTTVGEADAAAVLEDVPELAQGQLDDVFLEGSPANKIRSWLQHCGSSVENLPEETYLPVTSNPHSHVNSFDDDLTLGAEAMLLPESHKTTGRKSLDNASCSRFLQLGNSMASSGVSSWTNKTSSSVSEILELCQEDPESILFNLGFAGEQPQPATKIPTRFFQVPSQLKGINFRMFLEAQVQRMEMEDPCLLLANRFRQVETLMTTANAFYCLYSYVSKTPVQKIAPSYSFMDHGDIPDIMVTSPKPQPGSPIDRLKRAVSRMCLYSPSRDRDTPPKANLDPKRNLSRWDLVVQEVLEKVREDKLQGKQKDISASNRQVKTVASSEQLLVSRGEAWPVKLTKTSAVSSNELKSKVLKARALPNCPTQRLPSATIADQPVQTMGMAQTLEERSPPTGPEKMLKSQRKLYFFPEEDLSLTQHECDAGMSAVEMSNVSTEAVKTWPPNEALPTDSYTNCQSALNTEDRLGNIKAADDASSMHTQNRGSYSDSWSSTLCKGGQTEYQEHNCGFQLSSASSHDTNLTETSKRTLVGGISDDHETGTNLSGSTSGNVHDISENVPFWQASTCAWAANRAVHPSDCCRDGLTTSSVRETKEQIISGPIFSNRASKRYQGIVESATLDCTRPSEHTWTLSSSVETSPARRTCLQENSFEMEEIQSNEGDPASTIENTSAPLSAVKTRRKRFSLNADSAQSGSSGFIDDLVLECMAQVLDLQQSAPLLGGHFKL